MTIEFFWEVQFFRQTRGIPKETLHSGIFWIFSTLTTSILWMGKWRLRKINLLKITKVVNAELEFKLRLIWSQSL